MKSDYNFLHMLVYPFWEKRPNRYCCFVSLCGACRICLTWNSLVALCAGGWCECTRYHCWHSSCRPCWKKATGTHKSVRCDCSLVASVSCLLPHFLDITWHQLGTWSSKVRDCWSCFSKPIEQNIVSISSNMFGLLASRLGSVELQMMRCLKYFHFSSVVWVFFLPFLSPWLFVVLWGLGSVRVCWLCWKLSLT